MTNKKAKVIKKHKKEKSTIHNNINIKIGDSATKKTKRKRTTKKKAIGISSRASSAHYNPISPYTSIEASLPYVNKPYYVNTESIIPKPPLLIKDSNETNNQILQLQDQMNRNSSLINEHSGILQQGIKYLSNTSKEKASTSTRVKNLITREQQIKYNERARLKRQQAKLNNDAVAGTKTNGLVDFKDTDEDIQQLADLHKHYPGFETIVGTPSSQNDIFDMTQTPYTKAADSPDSTSYASALKGNNNKQTITEHDAIKMQPLTKGQGLLQQAKQKVGTSKTGQAAQANINKAIANIQATPKKRGRRPKNIVL